MFFIKGQIRPPDALRENLSRAWAVNGAKVYVEPGIILEDAIIIVRDGLIEDVGTDFRILLDPEQRAVRSFTTVGVPETFLVDSEGVVRARWVGRFFPFDEANLALIESVLDLS